MLNNSFGMMNKGLRVLIYESCEYRSRLLGFDGGANGPSFGMGTGNL
jgi:hypothetical protein